MKRCANCGRTLNPIDAMLSRYCRRCADDNVSELSNGD